MFQNVNEWEKVNATTTRLDVPGGYLYRVTTPKHPPMIVFVADPPLAEAISRAAAHLGTGNAATDMGAIEAHSLMVKEAGESISSALSELARAVEGASDAR